MELEGVALVIIRPSKLAQQIGAPATAHALPRRSAGSHINCRGLTNTKLIVDSELKESHLPECIGVPGTS